MATAFLWRNLMDTAAFTGDLGTPALAALPLTNLRDPQPSVRTRWVPPTGVQVWTDFGASVDLSCVLLLATTLGIAGGTPLVRLRLSDDPGFLTTTWDTGAIDPATSDACGGNVVLLHPTVATGRYMLVEMEDPAAGLIDVGRIIAGPLWRLAHAHAYGIDEGRRMLTRRDRNEYTGAEFPVPALVDPREVTFTAPLVTRTEAAGEWRAMLDQVGASGDVLWIPSDGLSLPELNRRCIWGAPFQAGAAALLKRANFVGHSSSFGIVERV